MCGLTGLIHKSDTPIERATLQKMNRRLVHRGPDDEGYLDKGRVGLAHRRLSIIDLGGGHQPMTTEDRRYSLVFNGEIYNFLEIRGELESLGYQFRTRSDSEVLLKAYAEWGRKCLAMLNGMFAFAIWDARAERLFAARDRMGKKPFYYWETPYLFAFASELKAFTAHPDFSKSLDQQALAHYFQYEYVPAPFSIYEGVKKLPAGCLLEFDGQEVLIEPYWDIPLTVAKIKSDETEVGEILIKLLDQAVERRLVSDVPLGVFLSGGIDSSAVVALMSRHRSGSQIKTFSIGFAEKSFDESDYARQIATRFHTDHYHQQLTPDKLVSILPEVVSFLDEPFADGSIIPTYLLAKFTREHVTVALGGDGGDELFAGYPTFNADRYADYYQRVPTPFRKTLEFLARCLPVSHQNMSFDFKLNQFLYGAQFPEIIRNQVWLGAFHSDEQTKLFLQYPAGCDPLLLVRHRLAECPSSERGDRLLYFYQKFYLCDDILFKTDRAAMATSLEVRAPFLDVELINYASSIPYHLKLNGRITKYILKQALQGILPDNIIHRPKKGFGMPIGHWLRHELRDQLLDTLAPEKIKREGIFDATFIENLVQNHLAGKRNYRKQLFALLMFEWWREHYLD